MKNKIIATYKIQYNEGFTQIKTLISHKDFVNIFYLNSTEIDFLDDELRKLKKERKPYKHLEKKIKAIRDKNDFLFGKNFFTDESPLYKSIENGILELTPQQGGIKNIKITKC